MRKHRSKTEVAGSQSGSYTVNKISPQGALLWTAFVWPLIAYRAERDRLEQNCRDTEI